MEIGQPQREITVEPLQPPVRREPAPAPEREREPVPAGVPEDE